MTRIQRSPRNAFTLVEVVVVLGVVLLLSGIAIPIVRSYIEDAKRSRARNEVQVLGAAVMNFYKDVGYFPARDGLGADNTIKVLGSGDAVPTANPWRTSNDWDVFLMSATEGDTLDNHLLLNTPQGAGAAAYPTSGAARWYGPYISDTAPLDPWGRPYVVMMQSFWSSHATDYKKAFILSAGPDGVIDTPDTCTISDVIADDDIGIVLGTRP
jgi:prepilin-type N-terminal cleavage/methylation domain-containing protein